MSNIKYNNLSIRKNMELSNKLAVIRLLIDNQPNRAKKELVDVILNLRIKNKNNIFDEISILLKEYENVDFLPVYYLQEVFDKCQ